MNYFFSDDRAFCFLIFCLGAIVGSFLNVCILRIPEQSFFRHLRSVCPKCGKLIPIWNNVPIISFFVLGGRSRCCRSKISWQYPMIELMTAIMFLCVYLKFPFFEIHQTIPSFHNADFFRWFHAIIFLSLLLVMSIIDSRYMIIPDVLSLGMISASPMAVFLHPDLDWRSSLLGILLGGGVLYLVAWAYWLLRRQYGMGFGDVKLLAAIGGWLGWQAIFPTLFLGSIIGSTMSIGMMILVRNYSWQTKIPFGPFLALGAVIHLFWAPMNLLWGG